MQASHERFHSSQKDSEGRILLDDYGKGQHSIRTEVSLVSNSREFHPGSAKWAKHNRFSLAVLRWGMNVIGPIDPATLNGHHFILVAIDYFTKWIQSSTYKAVTKKVVEDFIHNNIVFRIGILESIITDNTTNLNSDLIREICE